MNERDGWGPILDVLHELKKLLFNFILVFSLLETSEF